MSTRLPDRQHSRAVLIGVGTYDHLSQIPAAANNVADLEYLLTASGGVLDPANCRTMQDPAAHSHVGDIVVEAAERAGDLLIVYYTGHGLLDRRGRLYLTLTGTHPDRTTYTALPFQTLRESIIESPAATRILILDCCFSGRALDALTDGPDAVLGEADIAGTYVITSSARNETSYAPPGQRHTAFTAALLAAATATPGLVLDDLYIHTKQHLHRHGHPHPQRRTGNDAGRIVLFPQTSTTRPRTTEELERALTDQLRVLGPDHPDTLNTGHALAGTYRQAGRLDDAIHLYERILTDSERVWGADNPDTLTTGNYLAATYSQAGRLDDAINLLERILPSRQQKLGPDHPYTLDTGIDLAENYSQAGRLDDAINLYERILTDYERVLGPGHADTLTVGHNLAIAYRQSGRLDEAIDLFEHTLAERRRTQGADHPHTLITRRQLAIAYQEADVVDDKPTMTDSGRWAGIRAWWRNV